MVVRSHRHAPRVSPLHHEQTRMQAFSDGVFAFAATLLVVSLEVPNSYDELLDALAGFPALALAFAAIVSLWAIHRGFFARYPLGDPVSVAINAVLLFIVLIYVYPLKLLAELAAHRFLRVGAPPATEMTATQLRGAYVIFSLAVLATSLAIAALHHRAWQLRETLHLDQQARRELVAAGWSYVVIGLVACVAIVAAALDVGAGWGLPIWLLVVVPPVVEVVRSGRLRRRPAAGPHTA